MNGSELATLIDEPRQGRLSYSPEREPQKL
jgi:hypothetical protein